MRFKLKEKLPKVGDKRFREVFAWWPVNIKNEIDECIYQVWLETYIVEEEFVLEYCDTLARVSEYSVTHKEFWKTISYHMLEITHN